MNRHCEERSDEAIAIRLSTVGRRPLAMTEKPFVFFVPSWF